MSIVVNLQSGLPELKRTPWTQFDGVLAAGETKTIDSIPLAQFARLTYILSIYNDVETQNKSMNIAVQKQGISVSEQVFGISGSISFQVNSGVTAGEYNLIATNSEAFAVNYCLTTLTS